jgi:exodeoxyribonuclease VII large subunit
MEEMNMDPTVQIYTPSELNREAKLHLEAGFPRVMLEAEISNLARPASGHLYFSLKDSKAQIRCAMFRSSAIRSSVQMENGKQVIARGRISLYEARGEYQFIVDGLREAGEGVLRQKFELLKKKLETEGLFEPALKKSLPVYPARIGVITSSSGAVVRDILHVMERRWPVAEIRLYPVSVQGLEAAGEICAALKRANREKWAELLILGRGGGSLEDLQAFNEEAVARSIANSELPVISAVGHETDFSISDFVADLRAPTPSAAAELATPDQAQLRHQLDRTQRMLSRNITTRLQHDAQSLDYISHRLAQRDPAARLAEQRSEVNRLESSLNRAIVSRLEHRTLLLHTLSKRLQIQHPQKALREYRITVVQHREKMERLLKYGIEKSTIRLHDLGRTLHAVSPLATMGRGYAVLSDRSSGEILSSASDVDRGGKINAQLSDGRLYCTVDKVTNEKLDSGD